MKLYILSRLGQAALTIFGISVLVFALARLSGDATTLLVPPEATAEERAEIRSSLGLDKPMVVQYGLFLKGIAQGDFGNSFRFGEPALDVYLRRFPNTLQLALAAALVAAIGGIGIGVFSAINFGGIPDRIATLIALLGQAVPSFWVAILMIIFFSVNLGWLPTSGKGDLRTFIMPAIALAWGSVASLTRLTRSSMLDVLDADYIRLARLKGLPEHTIVWKHAFRNALIPILTVFSLQLVFFISGSVIIENIFAWPGIGQLAVQAISARDYPLVQTVVFLSSSLLVLINLLVDLLYVAIDPRIRLR
jgi:peptide/nickel transport system permease protein